ncbi:uncharacterized protein EV422DRAFT_579456, partial [Fimicolochytrium jonesii]|uniref:uncharacterized protein n=1 Tax=Fimicolochytrium jonesii TaxID=1396493 RepID=UPI0022FEF3A5
MQVDLPQAAVVLNMGRKPRRSTPSGDAHGCTAATHLVSAEHSRSVLWPLTSSALIILGVCAVWKEVGAGQGGEEAVVRCKRLTFHSGGAAGTKMETRSQAAAKAPGPSRSKMEAAADKAAGEMLARPSKVAEAADRAADSSNFDGESDEALADMATSVLLAIGDEGSEYEEEGEEEEGEEEGDAEEGAGEEEASAAPKKCSGKSAKRLLQQEKTRMVNFYGRATPLKTADVDMGRMREAAGAEARPATANLLGHSAQRSLARALVDQLDGDDRKALGDDAGSISGTIADVVVAEGALIMAAQSLVEICRLAGEPLQLIVASSRNAGRSYLVMDSDDTMRIVAGGLMGQPVDTTHAARRAVDTYVRSLFVEGEKNGGRENTGLKKMGMKKKVRKPLAPIVPIWKNREGLRDALRDKYNKASSRDIRRTPWPQIRALTNPLLVVGWPPYLPYGHIFGRTASKEEVASFSLYWDCIQLRRREDVSFDDLFAEERPGEPLASVPGVTKSSWEGAGPTAAQIEALSGPPVSEGAAGEVSEGASVKVAMEGVEGVEEEAAERVAEKTAERAAEKAPGEAEAGKRKRAEEEEPEQAPPEKRAKPTAAAEEEGSEEEGSEEEGSDRDTPLDIGLEEVKVGGVEASGRAGEDTGVGIDGEAGGGVRCNYGIDMDADCGVTEDDAEIVELPTTFPGPAAWWNRLPAVWKGEPWPKVDEKHLAFLERVISSKRMPVGQWALGCGIKERGGDLRMPAGSSIIELATIQKIVKPNSWLNDQAVNRWVDTLFTPRQPNDQNCGTFVCMMADAIACGAVGEVTESWADTQTAVNA